MGTGPSRLVGVDILRGVAVLAVVVHHAPFSMRGLTTAAEGMFPPSPFPEILDYGRLGVQLFLVISGFCIHLRWARDADTSVRPAFIPFWKRRLARLYPPYFIALCGALAATFALNSIILTPSTRGLGPAFGYADTTLFVADVLLLVFMLQNLTPAAWRVNNGPFWSLALEEQLYLLYFPLLWMRRRWGWGATFAVATVATLGWRSVGAFLFEAPPFFWFIVGPAFWLPWALGAYAAELYFGHQRVPRWAKSFAVAALLFAVGVLLDPPKELVAKTSIGRVLDEMFYAGAFFVLLTAVVLREREGRLPNAAALRVLAQVGVWSYGIYLIHMLAMIPLKQVLVQLGVPSEITLTLRIVAGIGVGWVFYRVVERPFHRVARGIRVGLVRAG